MVMAGRELEIGRFRTRWNQGAWDAFSSGFWTLWVGRGAAGIAKAAGLRWRNLKMVMKEMDERTRNIVLDGCSVNSTESGWKAWSLLSSSHCSPNLILFAIHIITLLNRISRWFPSSFPLLSSKSRCSGTRLYPADDLRESDKHRMS